MEQNTALKMIQVKATLLNPNPWNTNHVSPDMEEKLRESVKRFGVYKPIVCRELDNGQLQIIGGQHRWQAARDLDIDNVPIVNLGKISDAVAKEIGLVDNGRYGEDDAFALAELMKGLGNADELLSFLPINDDDLANIFSASSIALDDLEGSDDDLPDLDSITKPLKTHQIMRFKVPVEDSEWVQKLIESTMNAQGFLDDDAMSNAGNALVHLLKGALK